MKRNVTLLEIKRVRLLNYLDAIFNKFYPDSLEKIPSIGSLVRLLKSSKDNVRNFISEFLIDRFKSQKMVDLIWKEIWLQKDTRTRRMNYDIVLQRVNDLGYELVTTEEEYENMTDIPSMRDVCIKC